MFLTGGRAILLTLMTNSQAYFGKSVLDLIERGGDIATVQNIRCDQQSARGGT
jgi:hypothetical protein